MTKKIILQVDGGGILGITPAIILNKLETALRDKYNNPNLHMRDKLDLCCGTSTGAIIAGLVSAGVSASDIEGFYRNEGVNLFNNSKNPMYTWLWSPKFKRADFQQVLNNILHNHAKTGGEHMTVADIPENLLFMATAYNLCSYRTEFIKSDINNHKPLLLSDVISWSALSAAFYFGKINAPNYQWQFKTANVGDTYQDRIGAVFQDGGQGTQNCTLGFALTEILARGWGRSKDEEVLIISLGTGNVTNEIQYQKAVALSETGQTVKYLLNQARQESTPIQINAAEFVAASPLNNIKLYRLDYESPANYGLDDTEHLPVYIQKAQEIINRPEFAQLLSEL